MKFNLRWQILLAVLAFLLVAALLSFQVQSTEVAVSSGNLCMTRVPAAGGVFAEGFVGLPQYLNPLLSDPNPVDRQISSLIFDGLTRYDEKGRLAPVLAESWSVSEDGRTARIRLRQDITWQDGEPFTAEDVVFTYSLMQVDSFPGSDALKNLWQSVTINQVDEFTIDFVLEEPYSPFMEATTRGIMPAHLFDGDTTVNIAAHPFNQNPVGTGPWMVDADQDWSETGRLQLAPNPMAWRQGTEIPTLEFQFYPDEATMLTALQDGRIQAINQINSSTLPTASTIPGIRLFTAESPRYTELLFNMRETAVPLLQSVEGRQALAYALDRQQIINEVLNGQGLLFEGPYLPNNWAYNPNELTQYAQDTAAASTLLDTAGWTMVEGQTTRQNEGDLLNVRLLTLANEPYNSLAQAIADQWSVVGIRTEIITAHTGTQLREWLTNGEFDVALVDVTPTRDPDLYDFWSQEAMINGQNYGGWNNRRASEALESGRQLWGVAERRPSYDTFLRIFNNELPALSLYQHTYTYVLSDTVNNADIGKITQPRDRYATFANWFLLYKDVSIACPPEETG